jgi:bla regulator protein BlaR1
VANNAKGDLKATGVSTPRFAQWLSGTPEAGDRAVIDETGLTGRYNFTFKWAPVEGGTNALSGTATGEPATGASVIDQGGPSLFSALPEQLGLKLVPISAPVEVLVINHVEQPSPN